MTAEILVKYVHFICIFAIVGALVGEHLLIKSTLTRQEVKRLAIIDGIYGGAVILLLVAGFTLWFAIGKPAEIYSQNWIFHTKIGLFAIVGVLSIVPTLFFNKQKKGDPTEVVEIPKNLIMYIRLELLLVFTMPLLASLMAKGVGYFG
jgi:putative membrane protein